MAAIKDLPANPVRLRVAEGADTRVISAERGPAGKVWLTCDCPQSVADGWCQHRIDLLCGRYGALPHSDPASVRAFEQIVSGTRIQSAGRDADRSLNAFDACLKRFDAGRPERIHGRRLGQFTDLVSDLAVSAGELEDALSAITRLLERD